MICHTPAYSSILISSATDLPLLTITSTLHARSISLAFVLFKVGLPSPNWNYLNDLGIYSRHVLQAGTLTGYDCHISGIKKAHLSMSFFPIKCLTNTSTTYNTNINKVCCIVNHLKPLFFHQDMPVLYRFQHAL